MPLAWISAALIPAWGSPTATGIVNGSTNLNWRQPAPLAQAAAERTGLRTVIANDANAAAMGEMIYGAARDSFRRNALFLHSDRVSFLPSELNDSDAALPGAAAMVYNQH